MSAGLRVPAPYTDHTIGRESLWYAYAAGADETVIPPWLSEPVPPMETHVHPPTPAAAVGGTRRPLPYGTAELLGRTAYPHGQVAGEVADPLGHALVAAYGPQWYDPDNIYNPHRGYASPRCLYPVQVFADDGEHWALLDPDRHALTTLSVPGHPPRARQLALTGRYTRIPRGYRWFRGSLVAIETGYALRALAIGLHLFRVPAWVRLPDAGAGAVLAEVGLDPAWEWSLPVTVGLGAPPPVPGPTPADPPAESPDPVLAEVAAVNRAQAFTDPPTRLGSGVPADAAAAPTAPDWAELTWRRNSGRMPAGRPGFDSRRRRLPAAVVHDITRWLAVPAPGPTLAAVRDGITVSVALRDIDGYADGVHRVGPDGELVLHRADREITTKLEATYGYPLTPTDGCGVRHASMVWFLSVRPRELHAAYGPTAWTATQYAVGWAAHGLSLAASAADLYARPVRAFVENATRDLLGLAGDEMIALAAVVGTPRHASGGLLDIRL
ncbi:hypothetical protein [Micromonospora sp. NPDC005367]|uniref:hypothetical protein n=1 Tax=Micromonospora sp. NPDC005367 TaxID=3155590 RepID=UPI0033A2BC69